MPLIIVPLNLIQLDVCIVIVTRQTEMLVVKVV